MLEGYKRVYHAHSDNPGEFIESAESVLTLRNFNMSLQVLNYIGYGGSVALGTSATKPLDTVQSNAFLQNK